MKVLLYIVFFPLILVWDVLKLCVRGYRYFFGFRSADGDGVAFEYTCADILMRRGFHTVSLTKSSGDQGVDILACKGTDLYAVQCKLYSHSVGNKAVQEVYAGKDYYNCSRAAVMTNSYFTQAAVDLADKLGVDLWDNTPTSTKRRRSPAVFWLSLIAAVVAAGVMAWKGMDPEKVALVPAGWLTFIVLYIIVDPIIKIFFRGFARLFSKTPESDSDEYEDDEYYDDYYEDSDD